MLHQPCTRLLSGAETAVLFVHGILGTPDHFIPFLSLVPPEDSVINLLLEGHGGSVRDFSAASMDRWKQQVCKALQTLRADHNRVVIAAHSMGTLLAIQEAVKEPVAALFLLNVPLSVRPTPQLLPTVWAVCRSRSPLGDQRLLAARNACSIQQDPRFWRYLGWVPRYAELFSEIGRTRKLVQSLTVPCYAYFSLKDEMVSPKSAGFLAGNPFITVKTLAGSGHFYYTPEDLRLLQADFSHMLHPLP